MRQSGQGKLCPFAYRVLPARGWLMIAAGALCAVAAVMEVPVYRQFAAGGRFHYQGYGPGSFMWEMIEALALAPAEAEWFAGLPFLDARPVAVMAIPFAVAAFVLLWANVCRG